MDTLHAPFTNPARKTKRAISAADLLIWAYRDLRIDHAIRSHALSGGPRAYGSAVVWGLGMHVDGSRASADMALNEDALRVHGAVTDLAVLDQDAAAMVVIHARAGTEPEWHGRDSERIVPVMRGSRYAMEMGEGRRPIACRVRPRVDPHVVAFSRRMWTSWRCGLDLIARELQGKLFAYDVSLPTEPFDPWLRRSRGTAAIADQDAA